MIRTGGASRACHVRLEIYGSVLQACEVLLKRKFGNVRRKILRVGCPCFSCSPIGGLRIRFRFVTLGHSPGLVREMLWWFNLRIGSYTIVSGDDVRFSVPSLWAFTSREKSPTLSSSCRRENTRETRFAVQAARSSGGRIRSPCRGHFGHVKDRMILSCGLDLSGRDGDSQAGGRWECKA